MKQLIQARWWQVMAMIIGLLFLAFYEAAQQYYYVVTFNLRGDDPIFFQEVLFSQLIKWLVWIVVSIPFMMYVYHRPLAHDKLTISQGSKYFVAILSMLFINILLLSILHIFSNGLKLDVGIMAELMVFYTFQKGPIYILAYIGIIILVHLFRNRQTLKLTIIELSCLRETNRDLYEKLRIKSSSDTSLTMNVKIGNKWKHILLEEINYIEADDYCVKLYIDDSVYTHRISMKNLEKRLPESQFLRIHRKYIVNRTSIAEFQFGPSPHITLKSGRIISIAQSRLKSVRQLLSFQTQW